MTGSTPKLVVLRYRRIGRPPEREFLTTSSVPELELGQHIATLRRQRFIPLDVDAFVTGLADPSTLPPRAVLLTFDGGFRSFVDSGLPVLRNYRAPAVVFVAASMVGSVSSLDVDADPAEKVCTWSELQTISGEGVSIESMGVSHTPFDDLQPAERKKEIVDSKETIEKRIGREVRLFAWPLGRTGAKRDDLALDGAGYAAALLARGKPFEPGEPSRWRIPRVPVSFDTDLADVLRSVEETDE